MNEKAKGKYGSRWTREEVLVALYVYGLIPFSKCSSSNEVIKKFAKLLGRTPGSLGLKISNIASLDPKLKNRGVIGMVNGAKMDKNVWEEFIKSPYEILEEAQHIILENGGPAYLGEELREDIFDNTDNSVMSLRMLENYFKSVILTSYNHTCCVTGLKEPLLVEACHIIKNLEDKNKLVTPQNGLCLNPLFHKAYDTNLMSITPDYEIIISDRFMDNSGPELCDMLDNINGRRIIIPDKFEPSQKLLDMRYQQFRKVG